MGMKTVKGLRQRVTAGLIASVLLAGVPLTIDSAGAGTVYPGTTTITSSNQTPYMVPSGTVELQVMLIGQTGGGGGSNGVGGAGAEVTADIPVPAGVSELYAEVATGGGTTPAGTTGGGETALQTCGSSCTYTANPASDPRLLVAGGGGSGGIGEDWVGGAGGSAGTSDTSGTSGSGGAGSASHSPGSGGSAGFTSGTGTAGSRGASAGACSSVAATAGGFGQGGRGGYNTANFVPSGGGGGGGWVGGSGGGFGSWNVMCANAAGADGGGGGAGLSFVEADASDVSVTSAPVNATPEVQITPLIEFSSTDNTTFTAGQPGSFTVVTAAGQTASLTEGGDSLPSGISFVDNGDGTASLSGTPAPGTGGVYDLSVVASNGQSPTAQQSFTLTVDQAPAITSADSAAFQVDDYQSFTVTSTGYPTPSLSANTAALPSGLGFVDNGNGTATISGTPTASGPFSFEITGSNGIGPDAVEDFTLNAVEAPAFTSAADDGADPFIVGTPGSFRITTSGFSTSATTIVEIGSLPDGLAVTDNGDGTATLAGTPSRGGLYPITLEADNGVDPTAVQSFVLSVDQAPSITSATEAMFPIGEPGSFDVTAAGYPIAGLSETGSLPDGLTFTDNGDGTATISGTPASDATTADVTVTASNGVVPDAKQQLLLTVDRAPAISSAAAVSFTVGRSGTFPVTTTGSPSPTTTETGALPSGVTFDRATSVLSGTPAKGSGGVYHVTLVANNGTSPDAVQTFTLTVDQAPAISSAAAASFTVGRSGTFPVTTTGSPSPTTTETGALPSGVTFDRATSVLSGTPAKGSGGVYHLTLVANNGTSPDAVQTFTLTVDQAPAITGSSSTTFRLGKRGSFTVATTGYPQPRISTKGVLPSGVALANRHNGTGLLAGIPAATSGGTYEFTITASNGPGSTTVQDFTLTVVGAAACSESLPATTVVGMATSADGRGYWIASSTGLVAACGDAANLGQITSGLSSPVAAIAGTPDGKGFWLSTSAGRVYAFGDAATHGDVSRIALNKPIVAMTADPATGGYWLLGSDGGVFSFDAPFFGSTGNDHLVKPAVGLVANSTGTGYWFVASDGGVFTFGRATFHGSAAHYHLYKPVVGIARDSATGGYWLLAADGGVFSFGAPFYGSTGGVSLAQPAVAMSDYGGGVGYRFVASDGRIYSFKAPWEGSAVG